MKKLLLLLLLSLPLLSCDKEADFRSSELHTPIVTGIQLIDDRRHIGPTIGKPNDKKFDNPQLQLWVYPNYAWDVVNVNLIAGSRVEAKLWLVQATVANSLAPHLKVANATLAVVGGDPLLKVDNFIVNGSSEARIVVSALPEGVYRLYVPVGDQLAWQNIWINRN